jgi:hypothetical protein
MVQALQEPIGVIKMSIGGTDLAEAWSPQRKGSLYHKLRALTEKAGFSRSIRIVGMVWMQGGKDAREEMKAKAYRDNLQNFIKRARHDFGNPDMVFVCGRSASPPEKFPYISCVRDAQEHVGLPNYAWVDCDSISMGKDRVHYNTKGQVQTGRLFADAAIALMKQRAEQDAPEAADKPRR